VLDDTQTQRYCSKCKRTLSATNFYRLKDGTKSDLCKSCETMHVNNFEPDTFTWLLEKYDVPYAPTVWNILRDRAYKKDPYKMNGMSVFGKYLSTMKLKQWKKYTYADTELVQEQEKIKAQKYGQPQEIIEQKIAQMKEAYARGEISEAQYQTYVGQEEESQPQPLSPRGDPTTGKIYPENDNPFEKIDLPDPGADLTEEDKIYLATKWGRLYSAADWVFLEKTWEDYNKSFDLHNADLINGTKQLCKLELKGNQALDTGDIESYSKIARASDSLRKSLKFTEAQRKEAKEEDFGCYGQIVAFAEKNNPEDFIRPIDLSIERDIVDKDIQNIKNYTKTLIEDDPAVFKMIEQYIQKRENLAQQEADQAAAEDGIVQISDEDLKEYNQSIEEQMETDSFVEEGEE
jgi:hypothetical protein